MGFVTVSKYEIRRIEVLSEVVAGRRSAESAATVLGISTRQARWDLKQPQELIA